MNRKADMQFTVAWLIICVVVILGVVLIGSQVSSGIRDFGVRTGCKISLSLKSFFSVGMGIKDWRIYLLDKGCPPTMTDIDGFDWKKCNLFYGELFKDAYKNKDSETMKNLLLNCATQQIVEEIHSCWSIGGKGMLNPGDFECFDLCIKPNAGYNDTFGTFLIDQNRIKYIMTKEKSLGTKEYYTADMPLKNFPQAGGSIRVSNLPSVPKLNPLMPSTPTSINLPVNSNINIREGEVWKVTYIDENPEAGQYAIEDYIILEKMGGITCK